MKPASAKQKGRKLQQWVRDKIIDVFGFSPKDIHSRSMGAQGTDVYLSEAARHGFPFAVECKNVEKLNVYEAFDQACENADEDLIALLVIKKNGREPLVVIDADYFFKLVKNLPPW